MPSNYPTIDVFFVESDGARTAAASTTVKVRNTATNTDIATLTTDSNGHIAAGTLSVAAGTLVRFRVENYQGRAHSVDVVTT